MGPTKFVVRLMDNDNNMLGWGAVMAEAKGDGALYPVEPLNGHGEVTGVATSALIHWADVNLRCRAFIGEVPIKGGAPFALLWTGPILRLDNPADHDPLPPVTIHNSVEINVPTGNIGIKHT